VSPRKRAGIIPEIQAAGRGIVIKIEGDGESARKALEMVQEQLRHTAEEAEHSGGEIAEAMEMVKRSLEYIFIYSGIRETVEGIKELVGGSLELGEAMVKAHERTGLAVETLSTLHYAAALTGSDFDGLVNGVGRMERQIAQAADGNKEAAALMKALGLNAKELSGQADGAEIAFHKFVATLAATESPMRRNELAMQLMGRAGQAQIPVLIEIARHWDEFKQKADDAGVLLTGKTAQALADTNQRFKDMEQHIKGAGLALTEGMSPGLSQMLSIISGGKSQMDTFNATGQGIAKTFAFVGEVIYSAAAAAEMLFSLSEGGRLTEGGRKDADAAIELKKQADEMHDLAFGKGSPQSPGPLLSGGEGAGGDAYGGTPPPGGKAKSDDGIARAAEQLLDESARAKMNAQKNLDEQMLAELETQHKLMIVSDQEFYQEKLRLQNDALDAEMAALETKGKDLQALYDQQHKDKTLKRDKNGNSAQELATQRQLLQVQEQMANLQTQRARNTQQNTTEVGLGANKTELESLKLAAELEKERGAGIAAQIALLQKEASLEAEKVRNAGGSDRDVQNIQKTEQLAEAKLRIGEVNRQITTTEENYALAVQAVTDAAEKNPALKLKAEQQINQIHREEAAQLQSLIQQYTAMAELLGGEYVENAKKLNAELGKLTTPSQKESSKPFEELAKGIGNMASQLSEASIRGKDSFRKMKTQILGDVAEMAIKFAEQKWLLPLIAGAVGGQQGTAQARLALPGFAAGGDPTGPSIVGENGPEIFVPKGPGTVVPNNVVQKLADSGGGGKAPNVTTNIVNQTSTPVTAQPSQVSYDEQLRSFVIHTILTDQATGGALSQAPGS
jgi:hypothetical protein